MTPHEATFCEEHPDTHPIWHDDGGPESGPGEPYLVCPDCMREQKDKCPKCGAIDGEGYEVHVTPTRQYGGGYDTFYNCLKCGYQDVAT